MESPKSRPHGEGPQGLRTPEQETTSLSLLCPQAPSHTHPDTWRAKPGATAATTPVWGTPEWGHAGGLLGISPLCLVTGSCVSQMGRLSSSTVLTACSASLRTALRHFWGEQAGTGKGPPPTGQRPRSPGARQAGAPLWLRLETPSSPSVCLPHLCAQGCRWPLRSMGLLCFGSQCPTPPGH